MYIDKLLAATDIEVILHKENLSKCYSESMFVNQASASEIPIDIRFKFGTFKGCRVLLVDDPPLVSFPKFFHTSMNMLENVAANNEQKTDGIQPLSHKMYGVILARLVMCYNEIE